MDLKDRGDLYRLSQDLDEFVNYRGSFCLLLPNCGYFELGLAFLQTVKINRRCPCPATNADFCTQ